VLGNGGVLLDQLRVGDTGMIYIMNQRSDDAGKLRERVGRDAVGMIMERLVSKASRMVHGRSNDAREKLGDRHGNMASVFKIVKRIVSIAVKVRSKKIK
jgi:hypothetical protein